MQGLAGEEPLSGLMELRDVAPGKRVRYMGPAL
jgi:hypothetical protein